MMGIGRAIKKVKGHVTEFKSLVCDVKEGAKEIKKNLSVNGKKLDDIHFQQNNSPTVRH